MSSATYDMVSRYFPYVSSWTNAIYNTVFLGIEPKKISSQLKAFVNAENTAGEDEEVHSILFARKYSL